MSSNYKAVILVGLPFKSLFESFDEYENFDYGIHKSTCFDIILPYYDAELEDCLVGFTLVESGTFNYKEVAASIETQKNRDLFKELTGKDAKVYLTVSWS